VAYLFAVAALAAVYLAWQLYRRDRTIAAMRDEAAAERRQLYQRIQAPRLAVAQAAADVSDGPLYVPSSDTEYADRSWDEHVRS